MAVNGSGPHRARAGGLISKTNKYLQKSAITRVRAVGGFFISIPVFLTGIILYTFIQFPSTPAVVTSVFIGVGIVFCGCAMVHNVFVWQKEKTNLVRAFRTPELSAQNLNTSNGVLLNGHLNNTGLGVNLSFHSVGGPAYAHPITLLQQGPYVIRVISNPQAPDEHAARGGRRDAGRAPRHRGPQPGNPRAQHARMTRASLGQPRALLIADRSLIHGAV
ncbi:hypothetical protein EVAR_48684_1 [Eumeta japonica]|uniref:Uncharacterized protein n=1 Tax=Eumeta variegata TaxID=151549 RepID=A0A4C1XC47_EUMVA|nr:hypothetical protein EVAR_48684_1 [Eumeta japonica]